MEKAIRLLAWMGVVAISHGQVPGWIHYQARIVDGTNLVNSTVGISLRLFNVPTGGSSLYEDSNSVTVADGLYSTFIGDQTNSGNFAAALTNQNLWLETAVNGAALAPRERITSVAFSLNADRLDGVSVESLATAAGLTAETAERIAADASLSNAVASEAAARMGADTSLSNAVTTEAAARIAADASLSNAVASEAAARIGADASLSNAVTTEAAARIAADASLSNAVASEAAARMGADAALSNAVGLAWRIAGNAGTTGSTHFIGTTDNQAFEIRTLNQRVARFDTATNSAGALIQNVILGHSANLASNGAAFGSVIGGGGNNANPQIVGAAYDTVAGGVGNRATGGDATVAGGRRNTAGGLQSFVGGGFGNVASGRSAMIPGGTNNTASGDMSFAAGRQAKATNTGAFVWADSTASDFTSSADNQFLIRASGGVGIGTAVTPEQLTVAGNVSVTGSVAAASLSGNGAGVTNVNAHLLQGNAPAAFAAAAHTHAGADITSGTVAEPRIDAAIARDAEIVPTVLANDGAGSGLDADLLDGLDSTAFATGTPLYVFTETDPKWTGASNQYYLKTQANALFATGTPVYAETDPVWNAEKSNYATGTPLYVESDPNAWKLGGNVGTTSGVHFVGTADAQPVEIRAAGMRVALFKSETNGWSQMVTLLMGSRSNSIAPDAEGSTIAGGGYDDQPNAIAENAPMSFIAGGYQNLINTDSYDSVIGGGSYHTIDAESPYGTIAGGSVNKVSGEGGTIGGGVLNETEVNYATVAGGYQNVAGGDPNSQAYSVVSGGRENRAIGPGATVGGGVGNIARGDYVTIAGGSANAASNTYAVVGGGFGHDVAGQYGVIAGGYDNEATAEAAAVGGGANNSASGLGGVVAGGIANVQTRDYGTVSGGRNNAALGEYSTVGGGVNNRASNDYSTVAGGLGNIIESEYSTIGGGSGNRAKYQYSTIAGGNNGVAGNNAFLGGGYYNIATGGYSAVAGGEQNVAGSPWATIAGGSGNAVHGWKGSIGGGEGNVIEATATNATIPGGLLNAASGASSFAAGRRAKALHDGAFVWGDSNNSDIASTNKNSVTMRASGGYRLFSDAGASAGVELASGSGSWTSLSDEHAKKNFAPVDPMEILEKVRGLRVQTWSYRAQDDSIRHIGPTAQDFHEAFGVGDKPTGITTVDADGVALAAIQALARENAELKERIEALNQRLEELSAR